MPENDCSDPRVTIKFLRLSLEAVRLTLHDAMNPLTSLTLSVERISRIVSREPSPDPRLLEAVSVAGDMIKACRSSIDRLSPYYVLHSRELDVYCFKPRDVVARVVDNNPDCNFILPEDARQTTSVVFPSNVFEGMITELVANAKRFSGNERTTILLQWAATARGLECSVHDDAPSTPLADVRGFVPLDVFLQTIGKAERYDGLHGLDLLNRLTTKAGGVLLFGQSRLTSGMHVRFSVLDVAAAVSDEAHENK